MKIAEKLDTKIFGLTITFLLIFVAFGIYTYFRIQKQIIDHNFNQLINISKIQELKINEFYETLIKKLNYLPKSPTLNQELINYSNKKINSHHILDEFFSNYLSDYGLIYLLIVDEKGNTIYYYSTKGEKENTLIRNISWPDFKEDSVYLSDLFYDSELHSPVFEGKLVFRSTWNQKFLIVSRFNARIYFFKILQEGIDNSNKIESLLLQFKDGVITFISDSKFLGNIAFRLQSEKEFLDIAESIKKGNERIINGTDYRGKAVYAYLNYLQKWNWYLLVKIDQDATLSELRKTYFGIFGTILSVTFVFIFAMLGLIKKEREQFLIEADSLRKQKEIVKKQYEQITKIANDAILITNKENRIIDYNDKFLEFYKIENPESEGLNLLDFLSDNLRIQWDDYLKNIKDNNGLVFEAVHKNAKGEPFNVQVSAKFIEIEGNEYLIQIIRDFEERKRIEEELKASKIKAEESDRLKSNFLSMMSHEVRTPVNIILGAVDILQSNLNEEIRRENEHLFDMITRNGKRLLTLISDIIDISRIESNELKLEFIIRNVESLILDVVSEYEPVAKNKGLQIATNFKAKNPYARIDEVRFLQIITNLVSNAIKFTSQGGITILTENVDDTIHISVKDTGIGIPETAMKDIFGMFRQAHEGYGRNYEGAGLGLTITQKLTKMMGGEIKVESQVNVGSTFTVIFPTVKTEELDENLLKTLEERHKASTKPTILIVNNDKDESFYLETLMIRLGFDYFVLNDGKKIISFIKHKPVDCVIYSVNLQNEIETERVMYEIRNKIKLENLKIVALRSPDTVITEARLKEIGFNLVKTKPISFEEISKILYQILSTKN